jgi:predicted ATPase/DNA-binding SARP family transcriptional activator
VSRTDGHGAQVEAPVLASVRCAVLGPLEVLGADGGVCTPSGALQRRLLELLVLHRGRTVSLDRLAEVLWPEALPDDLASAVHTHVFRLRRKIPDLTIDQQPPGYRLRTDGLAVDVDAFETAISGGASLRHDDPRAALDALDGAIALWRGQPFESLVEHDDAAIEARRLSELRVRAVEERLAAMLDLGRAEETIADLEALVAREPLRERPRELLMNALAACGRPAEALRTYDHYRRVLADELGIDPSASLQMLNHALLSGELDHRARRADVAAPVATPAGSTERCLPPRLVRPLVGRQGVMSSIDRALDRSRVVTLLGTGGVGKTSLAVDAAHRCEAGHAGGVRFFELAGSSPGTVGADVLAALGAEPRADVAAGRRVADILGAEPTLVVLDNCEHVLDDVAPLVEALTSHTDHVTVLTTSRERLAVAGEQLVPVPPLMWDGDDDEVPAAVRLFAERARDIDPDFHLDESTLPLVTDICRQVDGLPLAIELAATRLQALDLTQIRDGLGHSHLLLSGGRRAVARHRSIAAALSWSFDLLHRLERELMWSLSIFASPFRPVDAAALIDEPLDEVTAWITDMVERSLVHRTGDRFMLLEPIRQFAEADDTDLDRRAELIRRHRRHFTGIAEEIERTLRTDDAASAFSELRSVLPDLRAAFVSATEADDLDLAARLCLALRDAAFLAMVPEAWTWAADLAATARRADHPAVPQLLAIAALGAWRAGDLDRSGRLLDDAREETARLGLDDSYYVTDMCGTLAASLGRFDEAIDLYLDALGLPSGPDDPVWRSMTHSTLVGALSYRHDPSAATEADRLVAELLPEHCPVGASWCWYGAGEAVLGSDPDTARVRLTRAVEEARASGTTFVEAVAGASLTSLEVRHGDPRRAVEEYRWLLPLMQRGEAVSPLWTVLRTVTELLVRCGVDEPAATLLGAVTSSRLAQRVSGDDGARLAGLRSTLVERLGNETFERACAAGEHLDDAAATALATAALDEIRIN